MNGDIVLVRLHQESVTLSFSARNPEIGRLHGVTLSFSARNPEIQRLHGVPRPFSARNPEIQRLLGLILALLHFCYHIVAFFTHPKVYIVI